MFRQISISLDVISDDDFIEVYDVFSRSFIWTGKFHCFPSSFGNFIVLNLRRIGVPCSVDAYQWHIDVARHHLDPDVFH